MDYFESDHAFDGDWDDRGELIWNEFDWKRYLKGADREVQRFLSIYLSLRDQQDRLDETARLMGWETEDWSSLEGDEATAEGALEGLDSDEASSESDDDLEPYTLHKHPVYVATRALYSWLDHAFQHFLITTSRHNSALQGWHCGTALRQGETQAILAIQALDLGDFALAVCHLKTGLTTLNSLFSLVDSMKHPSERVGRSFKREVSGRLFDLREIWLRVMNDCREEARRRSGGRD